ncbi:hypothetical protein BIW11_10238, partial [Tropilaelaps mercedesae]
WVEGDSGVVPFGLGTASLAGIDRHRWVSLHSGKLQELYSITGRSAVGGQSNGASSSRRASQATIVVAVEETDRCSALVRRGKGLYNERGREYSL